MKMSKIKDFLWNWWPAVFVLGSASIFLIFTIIIDIQEFANFDPEKSERNSKWDCLACPLSTLFILVLFPILHYRALRIHRRIANNLLIIVQNELTCSNPSCVYAIEQKSKAGRAYETVKTFFSNQTDNHKGIPDMADFRSSWAAKIFLSQFKTSEERERVLEILKNKGIIGPRYSP